MPLRRTSARSGCWAPIADFASKAAEHAIRLAAVQTLWGDPDAAEISAPSMTCGSTLSIIT